MSRRIVEVESESDGEVFDDDTDLPLPGSTSKNKQSLPNTGSRGALLEEISIEQEPTGGPEVPSRVRPSKAPQRAPPSGSSATPGAGLMDPSDPMYQAFLRANVEAGGGRRPETVLEGTPEMEKYKKWTCVYPIYIDAKRAYATGQRRVAREKSVWWPRSDDILAAVSSLRLSALHEPIKCHPRDWGNPGRVKVQWKQPDGRLTNPAIPTKKKLFELIAAHIQRSKPELVPDLTKLAITDEAPATADEQPSKPPPNKSPNKKDGKKAPTPSAQNQKPRTRPLPKAPSPLPPLSERYSPYSPLIPSGSLLEAWKVGTDKPAPGTEGAGTTPTSAAMGGKGKRKIIRIHK
ncbi:signal recognition particle subunit [Tulasnella sp. 417]|nr:signal recognition particle subunit [Tulasnella sp. 417]